MLHLVRVWKVEEQKQMKSNGKVVPVLKYHILKMYPVLN